MWAGGWELGTCGSETLPGPWISGVCWLGPWGPPLATLPLTLQVFSGLPVGGTSLVLEVSEEQNRSSALLFLGDPREWNPGCFPCL